MCLAVPAQVSALHENGQADVFHQGVLRVISVELVPEVKVGDYVILHVGLAIAIIDEDEALATLALSASLAEFTP